MPAQAKDTVYFLKEGRVKLARATGAGRTITLDILEAGDIFGAIAGDDHSQSEIVATGMGIIPTPVSFVFYGVVPTE